MPESLGHQLQLSQDSKPINELAKAGLTYENISGDGHCLYRAVSYYLGHEDIRLLRNIVAAHLEFNRAELESFIQLEPGQTLTNYLDAVRNGNEWASHVEIEVLMRVLDQPILIIGPNSQIINLSEKERFKGEPIFVYYNGIDHYDALTLKPGQTAQTVLANLQRQPIIIPPSSQTHVDVGNSQKELKHNQTEPKTHAKPGTAVDHQPAKIIAKWLHDLSQQALRNDDVGLMNVLYRHEWELLKQKTLRNVIQSYQDILSSHSQFLSSIERAIEDYSLDIHLNRAFSDIEVLDYCAKELSEKKAEQIKSIDAYLQTVDMISVSAAGKEAYKQQKIQLLNELEQDYLRPVDKLSTGYYSPLTKRLMKLDIQILTELSLHFKIDYCIDTEPSNPLDDRLEFMENQHNFPSDEQPETGKVAIKALTPQLLVNIAIHEFNANWLRAQAGIGLNWSDYEQALAKEQVAWQNYVESYANFAQQNIKQQQRHFATWVKTGKLAFKAQLNRLDNSPSLAQQAFEEMQVFYNKLKRWVGEYQRSLLTPISQKAACFEKEHKESKRLIHAKWLLDYYQEAESLLLREQAQTTSQTWQDYIGNHPVPDCYQHILLMVSQAETFQDLIDMGYPENKIPDDIKDKLHIKIGDVKEIYSQIKSDSHTLKDDIEQASGTRRISLEKVYTQSLEDKNQYKNILVVFHNIQQRTLALYIEKYDYAFETELPDAKTLLHLLKTQQITNVQMVYLLFNGFNPFLAGRDNEALVTELKKLNLPAINAFMKDCVELHQYIWQKQFSEALQQFDKIERRQTDYDTNYISRQGFKVKERGQRVANGIKRSIVHSYLNPGKKAPKPPKTDSSIYRDLQQQAHPLKVALNAFSQAMQNVYYEGHEGNLLVHIQALKLACQAYPELKIHFKALESLEKDYCKLALSADNQRLAEVKSGQWKQLDGQRGYFSLFRQYDDRVSEVKGELADMKSKFENLINKKDEELEQVKNENKNLTERFDNLEEALFLVLPKEAVAKLLSKREQNKRQHDGENQPSSSNSRFFPG